ncbi:MAG TPA: hypothetical protein RMF84_06860 [Polyangiaceae bacterium LLY-WYZ-14_1]|nr:hypothetical protein [Polyangiaceae bacterium LLY-WYZ-14_1]
MIGQQVLAGVLVGVAAGYVVERLFGVRVFPRGPGRWLRRRLPGRGRQSLGGRPDVRLRDLTRRRR